MNAKSSLSTNHIAQSYDQVYAEDPYLSDIDSLYEWVFDKLSPDEKENVIDIACGKGKLAEVGIERGVKVFGIDISLFAIKTRLSERNENTLFCVGDGEKLPFSNESFSYATNLGSLEHFRDMNIGLNEMVRVLRPGGTAAILLPNSYYLVDIIWKVWRTGNPPSHRQVIERFFTFNEWKDIIEMNGLQVIKSYKYNRFLPKKLEEFRWYINFPKRFMEAVVGLIIPRNLSYHFLFICRK